MKELTVGITTYNNVPFIYTLIYTIKSQVEKNVKILDDVDFVIYDDKSDDQSFLDNVPEFFTVIKAEKNSGAPGTGRNSIIENCQSRYILFIDGDDKLIRSISELVAELKECQQDILFSEVVKIGSDGNFIKSPFIYTEELVDETVDVEVKEKICVHQTGIWSVYNVQFLRNNYLRYHPEIRYEDNYFLYSILLSNPKIGVIKKPYYGWRINHDSFSYSKDSISQRVQLYRKTLELLESNTENRYAPYILYSIWNQTYTNIIRNYPKLNKNETKIFFNKLNQLTSEYSDLITVLKAKADINYVDKYFIKSQIRFANSFSFIYLLKKFNNLKLKRILKKRLTRIFSYLPMNKQKIVMTSHYGDYGSNPKYFYLELKASNTDKKIVYLTKDKSLLTNSDFYDYNNKLVYYYHFYTAKEIYFDSWLDPSLKKRKGQVWTQMWHGYPYKKIFTDIEVYTQSTSPIKHMEKVSNINNWDQVYSLDEKNSQIFKKLFPNANVIINDYPRITWLINNQDNLELKHKIKLKYGLEPEKKYTLFAPTYRPYKVYFDQDQLLELMSDGNQLLYNPHPMLNADFEYDGIQLKNIDIQEILLVIDELITDYSSIKYDFCQINDKSKVITYTPDIELYSRVHGLYEY